MPAQGKAAPNAIDQSGRWFWNFLKQELTPYPGRVWVVGRVTIAATIVMLLVMTFRLPGGFLGAIFTLFLSRENPTATFKAGFRTIISFLLGTAYSAIGVILLVDDPLTHFLWVAGSLFLSFYLIRVFADYGTAVAFGFMVSGAIPLWDETSLNVNDRMENTLWLAAVVAIGVIVTIVVEYVFRRVHPTTDLTEGIEGRLQAAGSVLRAAAAGQPLSSESEKKLSLYATVGTSRLRRLITRSDYGNHFKSQIGTAIALLGRLIDIAASFQLAISERSGPESESIDESDRERCRRLADEIEVLCQDLMQRRIPRESEIPTQPEYSNLPFLPAMERTVALVPKVFAGTEAMDEYIPAPLDPEKPSRLLATDAFSNPAHLQFALRGALAATACYVIYTSISWPGLSTSISTCIITALSTIGSSRQKQMLRLGGALIGGFIFGMGAQIFVLPHLDSIAGFTPLFIIVTAISAWIATSSAKLSYLGVQLALAFYLINLQEFTIQTSLAIARDRVFGVLLGLISMWLIYDRLWVRNATDEMQTVFARNLELFAELADEMAETDLMKAVRRIRQLRDQINEGFQAVTAQADAVLFEFGPSRQRSLQIREDFRRWQPPIRTLLLVQMASAQYRAQRPLTELPEPLAQADISFEKDIAKIMRAMASEVGGKPFDAVPDIRISAGQLQQEIRNYYRDRGTPVTSQGSDVIDLAERLASILSPLYEDVHSTFTAASTTSSVPLQLQQKPASS